MKTKLLIVVLFLLPITVMATISFDSMVKKECQYKVYGNGKSHPDTNLYIMGLSEGIVYMTDSKFRTSFLKKSSRRTVHTKACLKALNNISSEGFISDLKLEMSKLISTKY